MQIDNPQTIPPYGKIYRLTNKINNKMYHGQTIDNIENRWVKYKTLNCKGQPKLYNALKKYGPENFIFEVIDTSPQNQPQLDDLERLYISKFDSMNNGYNCEPGGRSGGTISDETKRKMSEAHKGISSWNKGIHVPQEIKQKISKSLKQHFLYNNHPFQDKHHSEETKRKISNNLKGFRHSAESIEKIRLSSLNRKHSEETKRKLSENWRIHHLASIAT